jgi:hypothetical protein
MERGVETSKYRKKPVVVEARQFWLNSEQGWPVGIVKDPASSTGYAIDTLEGRALEVTEGDWIITGVNGERYPCKPDVFEKTYEPEAALSRSQDIARVAESYGRNEFELYAENQGLKDFERDEFDNYRNPFTNGPWAFWKASRVASSLTPQPPQAGASDELASMTRMFHAACADLGAINEALGLDPEDGGAEPILDAIEELKTRAAPAAPAVAPRGELLGWATAGAIDNFKKRTLGHRAGEGLCISYEKYNAWDVPIYVNAAPAPAEPKGEQQSSFPERDATKTNAEQGLYRKFEVRRVDGSDAPGRKHHGCEYFVLDLAHDKHAAPALRAYASSCAETHPVLSADLVARYGKPEQHAATLSDAAGYDLYQKAACATSGVKKPCSYEAWCGEFVRQLRALLAAHNGGSNE